MRILAIDPGPTESAYVVLQDDRVVSSDKLTNETILSLIAFDGPHYGADNGSIVIEMIASYGMPVGAEVFETCVWIGRFMQASGARPVHRVYRVAVKSHLCHSVRATDANIRQALIDRYGGKEKAIGKKASKGPLYGVVADQWAALAVAVTFHDQQIAAAK